MGKQIFVVPKSDGAIIDILKKNGLKEDQDFFVTGCRKGSPYTEVEPEIQEAVQKVMEEKVVRRVRTEVVSCDRGVYT